MAEANIKGEVVVLDFSGKNANKGVGKRKKAGTGTETDLKVKRKSVALSDSERNAINDVFRIFDKNGDGKITCEEFEDSLKRLTSTHDLALNEEAGVETIIQQMTDNDVNEIDVEQFEKFYLNTFAQQEVDLRDAFDMFDTNKDGGISVKEFTNMMLKIDGKMLKEDMQNLFKEADQNNDGVIDFPEFLTIMGDAGDLPDTLGG